MTNQERQRLQIWARATAVMVAKTMAFAASASLEMFGHEKAMAPSVEQVEHQLLRDATDKIETNECRPYCGELFGWVLPPREEELRAAMSRLALGPLA